jgi:hypothetical protein
LWPQGGSGRRRCAVRLQGRGEGCNGGGAGAAYAAAAPCEFQITEIRDAACIRLFCPTVQPAAGCGAGSPGAPLGQPQPLGIPRGFTLHGVVFAIAVRASGPAGSPAPPRGRR